MMRKTLMVTMLGAGSVVGAQGAPVAKPQEVRVTPIFSYPVNAESDFTQAVAGAPGGKLIYYATGNALRVYNRANKTSRDVLKGDFRFVATNSIGDRLVLLRPAEDTKSTDWNAATFIWTLTVNPATGAAIDDARRVSVIPAEAACFSPDGKQIAFIAKNTPATGSTPAAPRKMMVIPAAGGQERVLFERGAPRAPLQWGPDGKWIYFAQASQVAGAPTVMSRVSVDGGVPTPVTPPVRDVVLGLAPDGQHVVALTKEASAFSVGLFDLNKSLIGETSVRLLPLGEPAAFGWAGDGLRAITAIGTGTPSVHTLNILDGQTRTLPLDNIVRVPTISPDGKRIALAGLGDSTLWEVKLMNVDGSGTRNVRAITSLTDLDEALWSPDGKFLAFPGDNFHSVHVANAATGKSIKAGEAKVHAAVSAWRSDSRAILYERVEGSNTKMQVSIHETTVDGNDRLVRDITPLLPASGEGWYGTTWVLNDSLAFIIRQGLVVSLRDGSTRRLYEPTNFGLAGLVGPRMSFDGLWIALASADRKSIDILATDGSSRKTLRLPVGVNLQGVMWRQPSKGPLIVSTAASSTIPAAIYAVPLDGSTPRALVTLPIGGTFNDITVSADQKTIVYAAFGRPSMSFVEADLSSAKAPSSKR